MTTEPRDLHEHEDDGFREIQLSGKQLVFLGMATTVVSIVIFLCGVLVGRGVRPVEPVAEAAAIAASEPLPADPAASAPVEGAAQAEPTPQPDAPPAEPPSVSGRSATASASQQAPAASGSSSAPPATAAAPPVSRPEPARQAATPPATAKPSQTAASADAPPQAPAANTGAAKPAPAAPVPAAAASGGGSGAIAVQVGALRERADAEALARRLSSKGYAAYIVSPDAGTPSPVYKVRVGNYTSADEAARVKRRLEQEEKLKPWVIR